MTCSRRRVATWCTRACSTRLARRAAPPTRCSPCSPAGSTRSPDPPPCCGSPTTSSATSRPCAQTSSRAKSSVSRSTGVGPGLDVALDNLLLGFSRLRDGVETIADRLSLDDPSERRAQLIAELRGVVRRLDAIAVGLTAALRPPAGVPAAVRWLERRGRKTPNVSLAAVPLDLAPILKDNLFDRVETVVLTSATLAAGGDFGYLEQRVGLDLPPSRVRAREIHASPFDFPAQCLFGIPTDLPEPRDDEPGHDAAVARVLVELAHASDGGMFVLFTSHGALRRAAEAVRGAIGGRWPLLVQGDGQRD